jgi:hypothetical protein
MLSIPLYDVPRMAGLVDTILERSLAFSFFGMAIR